MDNRASHHITCNKEILSNLENINQQGNHKVQVPTGSKCSVTHKGNASILGGCELKDVLYVPDFKFNLLLVSKLTKELWCCALFFPDFCVLKGLYNGKVMGIGRENCGLYILKWKEKPIEAMVTKGNDESSLWHMRLGHPSIMAMKHIPALKNKAVDSIQCNCEVCPLAKQSRLKFPLSRSKTDCLFHLIHLDVWGPHKLPTYDRKHDFLTIVDDFSRYTWVCLLQSKSEVVTVLKDFLTMVKTQFDMNVKVLRSDNGKEFSNSSCNELLASLGIGKSPYEILYNKLPVIDHLKIFGCLCFASNLPKGDKFAKRARKSVLIGYSEVQKGYRLFDLETNSIFISRDVSFREHIFPFREDTTTMDDCFPTQTTVPDYSSSVSTTDAQESYPTIATDVPITPTDNDLVTGDVTIPVAEILDTDSTTPNTEEVEGEHEMQDISAELLPTNVPEIAIAPHTSRMEPVKDQGPRKTTRTSKPPVWLKDYQTTKKFTGCCLYLLSNTLTYANISTGYQAYLEAFSAEV
ncbi:PREDICTED: uncharacterized protein LOC109220107 [Nicotiana attenuata]|uniref:uncharacterized protein LOC109220107 n=1 Tax=Nicotiana attenuata TaxID=49451 RepID=UPI000904DF91|nr:PREDICTED: uncharacterized protein LOC109220107 [Nicotiana attenuata]